MRKVSKEDYIDPDYKRLMKRKSGRKLIQILRLVAIDFLTIKQLDEMTDFSISWIRKLLAEGEKLGYLKVLTRTGDYTQSPGRKLAIKEKLRSRLEEKVGGRPEQRVSITGKGKWLMRFDPEVRDIWVEAEKSYPKIPHSTLFDSFLNLEFKIQQNPNFREFRDYKSDIFFGSYPLHKQILKPFLFVRESQDEEVVESYDDLVAAIKETVLPEHRVDYYRAVESSLSRLHRTVEKHEILLGKMQQIREVQEYLEKQKTKE